MGRLIQLIQLIQLYLVDRLVLLHLLCLVGLWHLCYLLFLVRPLDPVAPVGPTGPVSPIAPVGPTGPSFKHFNSRENSLECRRNSVREPAELVYMPLYNRVLIFSEASKVAGQLYYQCQSVTCVVERVLRRGAKMAALIGISSRSLRARMRGNSTGVS